jgi:hypothetical protein
MLFAVPTSSCPLNQCLRPPLSSTLVRVPDVDPPTLNAQASFGMRAALRSCVALCPHTPTATATAMDW